MSDHPQPADEAEDAASTTIYGATHPSVFIEQAPMYRADYKEWPRVPENTAVLTLNTRTGHAVVISGPDLRADSCNFYLPQGGRMLADDAPARILPNGIYAVWHTRLRPTTHLHIELPAEQDAVRETPPLVAQLQRGRRWLAAASSRAPLPPTEELQRLCCEFYKAEPLLGAFISVQVCATWCEFSAAAAHFAHHAIWGLEIIRRLNTVIEDRGSFPKWVDWDPKLAMRLRRTLPKEAWNFAYREPTEDDQGYYMLPIDLGQAVPLQLDLSGAWKMETLLLSGTHALPASTARALLAIWENVGAFIPLDNGTALICARTAETALCAQ